MRSRRILLLSAASLLQPAHSLAQSDATLEEVVVTAERREANLQTTSVSVSAFTTQSLERFQLEQTEDIGAFVPNMVMNDGVNSPSTLTVSLRGLGEGGGGIATSESAVSFYMDDVYQARLSATNNEFADIERVEVLRGPQGTLFGRNSMTGSVNVISMTPGDEGYLLGELSLGNYDTVAGKIAVGGPIVEGAWAASFSATIREQGEGYANNIVDGQDIDAKNFAGYRAKLHYYGGEGLDAVLTLYHTDNENDGFVATATGKPSLEPLNGNYFTVQLANDVFGDSEQYGASLRVSYELKNATFRSISAYSELADDWRFDLGGGLEVAPGLFVPVFDRISDIDQDQISQELQLFGSAGSLDWITGLYYFSEDSAQTFTDSFLGFGLPLTDYTIDSKSYAAYGQVTWNMTDRLSVIAGLRFTEDDKTISGSKAGPVSGSADSSVWTPKVGLEFTYSDNVFFYGTVSRGFRAGGFQGLAGSAATLSRPFEPEFLWAYEVGMKADLADRRVRLNLAAYFNDVSDLQTPIFDPNFPGNAVTENAIDMEYYGVEAEMTALIGDGLTLFGIAGWQDEDFTFIDPAAVVFGSGAERVAGVPHYNALLGLNYDVPLDSGAGVFLSVDYTLRDRLFNSADNNPISHASKLNRVNARLGYRSASDRWTLAIQGRNLTDEADWTNGTDIGLPTQAIRQALDPRTWEIEFSYGL